jgi:hypothetical protein
MILQFYLQPTNRRNRAAYIAKFAAVDQTTPNLTPDFGYLVSRKAEPRTQVWKSRRDFGTAVALEWRPKVQQKWRCLTAT